ncbi:MAG TPA: competence/damage-inducible protein A [Bryobacteraceae bacterium]|nr:competence/damage-inducible protein A [Bryobacteraceae bacterium]
MNAEIIACGSEMLTPGRVDTNSLYLTAQLNDIGVEVVAKSVIGDDRERMAAAIQRSLASSPILIVSGGLGPTEDDVTREAVSLALDRKLEYSAEIAAALERRFARAHRQMAEINKRQAFVVQGADVLENTRGTAPGQWIEDSGAVVMLLPGPPHELQAMFERSCLPRLARIAPPLAIRTLCLRVAGMAESDLDQLIAPIYTKYANPATTILAANGEIQVHLRARCSTPAEAEALLVEVGGPIGLLLGDRVYSRNGDPIETVVGALLRQQGATVSVAESCTGGMLGERITSVPGSSDYFVGGLLTYSNAMKTELLGVPPETLERFGAVSAETAEAMARGARRRTGSACAVSITCLAGPAAGSEAVPVGTVFVGVADAAGSEAVRRVFLGDRQRVRTFTTHFALDVLRRRLLGLSPPPSSVSARAPGETPPAR